MTRDPTGFVRDHYNSVAHRYDSVIRLHERVLLADGRQWVASRASGEVLEVAVRTGRNLRHYRPGTSVTGVDTSKGMVDIARSRASRDPVRVRLHVADVQHLPIADATFDTVVATSALCSIPDDGAAVPEAARVLRPVARSCSSSTCAARW